MPITFSALVYMGAPISQCGAWSRRPSTHKVVVLSSLPACCMFEEVQVSFREKNTRGWFGVYFSNAARRSGLRLLYVINFVPDSFFFFSCVYPTSATHCEGTKFLSNKQSFLPYFCFGLRAPETQGTFESSFPEHSFHLASLFSTGPPCM